MSGTTVRLVTSRSTATATLEETLARLQAILNSPHTPGWDGRARVDAINAFVDFHHGTRRKGNLTEAFVTILIRALEHELKTSESDLIIEKFNLSE